MNGKRGFIVQRNTHNKEASVDSDDKKLTTVDMTTTPTKISITIEAVGGRSVFCLKKLGVDGPGNALEPSNEFCIVTVSSD